MTVGPNEPFAEITSTAVQLAAYARNVPRHSDARTITSFLEAQIGADPAVPWQGFL